MQIDDDDPDFDPKIRWSKENNEQISSIVLLEKARFDQYMNILKFLEAAPRGMEEIADHFKLSWMAIKNLMHSLRCRGVQIEAKRDPVLRTKIFSIKARPLRIKFNPPSYYVKVKVRQK